MFNAMAARGFPGEVTFPRYGAERFRVQSCTMVAAGYCDILVVQAGNSNISVAPTVGHLFAVTLAD